MEQAKHTPIPLFHHRTDGGAEYLSDKFIQCDNGHKEGIFEGANYVVRLDGEPQLTVRATVNAELLEALKALSNRATHSEELAFTPENVQARAAIARATE